jgi:ribosome biogenesis GTPase
LKVKLQDLGFNNWFKDKLSKSEYTEKDLARVIAVNKDNYIIKNTETEMLAEITGKVIYGAESSLDLPAVGDWVYVQYFDNNTFAIIHDILPRKSLLKRKVAGKRIDYQPIAANIDFAFIMQSLDLNFNIKRLERYLIMANESDIQPVILLSKTDLISPHKLAQAILAIKSKNHNYDIFAFSNKSADGLNKVEDSIKPGMTYCLLGSSGVGKTTLINNLIGQNKYATNTVREKDDRGRHVTARRQLIFLDAGGMIIDTPGMRELGYIEVHKGLDKTFTDIQNLSQSCRFKNCTHEKEPGCSVINAVQKGELSEQHYLNYLKIRKEAQYYEMSYLEKRKRDKQFGKMCKEVMKNKKKR